MEIESFSKLFEKVPVFLGNKENLLKMEIERYRQHCLQCLQVVWNKENLLKMEIERSMSKSPNGSSCIRNKENLLKMEIERDEAIDDSVVLSVLGNKENLLKMEIESYCTWGCDTELVSETKKISWKWRLKARERFLSPGRSFRWNKENLLKMEIESYVVAFVDDQALCGNKENLLKMEIERKRLLRRAFHLSQEETKKISWKWRLKV